MLADVIDRNIATMLRLREETARRTLQAYLAEIHRLQHAGRHHRRRHGAAAGQGAG
jgi:hypothetical protein